jgi:hypothetical protein
MRERRRVETPCELLAAQAFPSISDLAAAALVVDPETRVTEAA